MAAEAHVFGGGASCGDGGVTATTATRQHLPLQNFAAFVRVATWPVFVELVWLRARAPSHHHRSPPSPCVIIVTATADVYSLCYALSPRMHSNVQMRHPTTTLFADWYWCCVARVIACVTLYHFRLNLYTHTHTNTRAHILLLYVDTRVTHALTKSTLSRWRCTINVHAALCAVCACEHLYACVCIFLYMRTLDHMCVVHMYVGSGGLRRLPRRPR
jgi:hypothetical protein